MLTETERSLLRAGGDEETKSEYPNVESSKSLVSLRGELKSPWLSQTRLVPLPNWLGDETGVSIFDTKDDNEGEDGESSFVSSRVDTNRKSLPSSSLKVSSSWSINDSLIS